MRVPASHMHLSPHPVPELVEGPDRNYKRFVINQRRIMFATE